ncbi:hypothetical protein [Nocardia rhamnosiphila]
MRELFAKDFPLPADIDFALPLEMAPPAAVAVRPGDLLRTEHGYLGLFTDNGRLLYLGRRGWPVNMGLRESLYVAAWRPEPSRRGYRIEAALRRLVPETTGQHKLVGPPRRRNRHQPTLDGVVAMVCETVEACAGAGVQLPVDGRAIFDGALAHGVEFDYSTIQAWVPRRTGILTHAVMAPLELAEEGIDGWVSHWHCEIGAQVEPGEPLVRVTNPLTGFDIDVGSPASGVLTCIDLPVGDIVVSGQRLGAVTEHDTAAE